MKDSFEELKSSPVSIMRIKYLTDTEDYILRKEFKSELDNEVYRTRNVFHQQLTLCRKLITIPFGIRNLIF